MNNAVEARIGQNIRRLREQAAMTQGILRRASARGKELPEVLRLALERQASMDTTAV